MTNTGLLTELAAEWKRAADGVLNVARAEAPLAFDDVVGLEAADSDQRSGAVPQDEIDDRVDALLNLSDDLLAEIGGGVDTIPVLLGALEVGNVLLMSSQDRQEAFSALGTDAGSVSLAGPSLVLKEFQGAVLGEDSPAPAAAPAPLPKELTDKLDSLQAKGAEELVALGTDAVLQQVLGNAATGLINLGGAKVERAFDWVKSQVNFIRQAAIRILKWVVDKFKSLVPKESQAKVDDIVKSVIDKLQQGVEPLVGTLAGKLLGRADAEEVWQKALADGKVTTTATGRLETVISGHIKRIGYVSTGRKAVAGAGAVVKTVLSIPAPQVRIVLGALVVALFGFVCWQLWDGFNAIESLVR